MPIPAAVPHKSTNVTCDTRRDDDDDDDDDGMMNEFGETEGRDRGGDGTDQQRGTGSSSPWWQTTNNHGGKKKDDGVGLLTITLISNDRIVICKKNVQKISV